MLWLNHCLLGAGVLMFVSAIAILSRDAFHRCAQRRARLVGCFEPARASDPQWRTPVALAMLAGSPLLVSAGLLMTLAGRIH